MGVTIKGIMNGDISNNLALSIGKIGYKDRCELLKQKGMVIWLTGISGSGKSTISIEIEKELIKRGILTYRLDGDNIRNSLCSDLGFSEEDRTENVRRIAEVASLFCDAGLVTIVSAISPGRKMREYARSKVGRDRFIEVYVMASLEACIKRDTKGLYKKALNGEVKDFTGVTSTYEEPENPELILNTEMNDMVVCAEEVLKLYNTIKGVDSFE